MKPKTYSNLQSAWVPIIALVVGGYVWRWLGGWTGFFVGWAVALFVVLPLGTLLVNVFFVTRASDEPDDTDEGGPT